MTRRTSISWPWPTWVDSGGGRSLRRDMRPTLMREGGGGSEGDAPSDLDFAEDSGSEPFAGGGSESTRGSRRAGRAALGFGFGSGSGFGAGSGLRRPAAGGSESTRGSRRAGRAALGSGFGAGFGS
ncbi:MAG: hypothetical protein JRI23_07545, partial [Deltaproteobacteria bacterium]|nr:hypothetical protein [Deltaproteobacteria bacterium]